MFDALLDRSVVFSFDRTGFRRHAKGFVSGDLDVDLEGRVCVVTGGNAGLGRSIAASLAARGGLVWILCRDAARGERARAELSAHGDVRLAIVDVSERAAVRRVAAELPASVEVLVHNAGALLDTREQTGDGDERTFAAHVVGPMLLTRLLLESGRLADGARVLTVSSGGMYTQRLDLAALTATGGPFDGVRAYALAKRAQVLLNEELAERHRRVWFGAMHPGWADTGGVRTALPRFHAVTRRILRTAEEGADTAVWLALRTRGPSGRFWFDRAEVPIYLVPGTRETPDERAALWDAVEERLRG